MNFDFLDPIDPAFMDHLQLRDFNVGKHILLDEEDWLPGETQVAIVGVRDDRGSLNKGSSEAPLIIRKALFKLFMPPTIIGIGDVGNIEAQESIEKTMECVGIVCNELMDRQIIPIIIGGSQNLGYGQYKAFQQRKEYVNFGLIDKNFRFEKVKPKKEKHTEGYLYDMVTTKPNFLFNLALIGSQGYLTDPRYSKLLNKLFFDQLNLGKIRDDIQDAEPLIRELDVLSMSINSLKYAEVSGQPEASPNGLYNEEGAQLMRYAGMSSKLSSIGFYDYNPMFDSNGMAAQSMAQLIWCFIEGVSRRKIEDPKDDPSQFFKYTIHNKDADHDLVFLKSRTTNRWWFEMPIEKARHKRQFYVPCSYKDYKSALSGDIPDRWIHAYNKLG